MAKKPKGKITDPLEKVFKERIAEFSNPKKREELWARSQAALGDVMEGGAKILEGVLVSLRDNGKSASKGSYRALQDAQSNYRQLRTALLRQKMSAERFDKSYRQIRETITTKFKAIEQKDIRKIAVSVDKAVNDGVGMVWDLVGKVFGG